MDKCIKVALTVIALCVVALPVKAEEKLWLCQMTGRAATTVDGGAVYENEGFVILVTRQKVKFFSSGFFEKLVIPMLQFRSPNYFRAGSKIDVLFFEDKTLHYAMAYSGAVAVTARCDDYDPNTDKE